MMPARCRLSQAAEERHLLEELTTGGMTMLAMLDEQMRSKQEAFKKTDDQRKELMAEQLKITKKARQSPEEMVALKTLAQAVDSSKHNLNMLEEEMFAISKEKAASSVRQAQYDGTPRAKQALLMPTTDVAPTTPASAGAAEPDAPIGAAAEPAAGGKVASAGTVLTEKLFMQHGGIVAKKKGKRMGATGAATGALKPSNRAGALPRTG